MSVPWGPVDVWAHLGHFKTPAHVINGQLEYAPLISRCPLLLFSSLPHLGHRCRQRHRRCDCHVLVGQMPALHVNSIAVHLSTSTCIFPCCCDSPVIHSFSAKNIMTDVFGSALPHIVGGGFAAGYVAALSGINMTGPLQPDARKNGPIRIQRPPDRPQRLSCCNLRAPCPENRSPGLGGCV